MSGFAGRVTEQSTRRRTIYESYLPAEWYNSAEPKPGTMLLERDEEPYAYKGLVILTTSYVTGKRQPKATILKTNGIDPEWGLAPGDRVMLSTMVNRRQVFGHGESAKSTYICTPAQVIAKLLKDSPVEDDGEAPGGRHVFRPAAADMAELGIADQGDQKAGK